MDAIYNSHIGVAVLQPIQWESSWMPPAFGNFKINMDGFYVEGFVGASFDVYFVIQMEV